MTRARKWIAVGAVALAAAGAGTGIAVAGGGDDNGSPITGDALGRASAAALAHTGGGRVTQTEVGDEEGYYEVEVTLADGSQVDVHLDRDFNILSSHADREEAGDSEGDTD